MGDLLTRRVHFIDQNAPIREVLRILRDHNISSLLVSREGSEVVGIVTERDIIRKFVHLDMEEKLSKPVRTLMTFPVKFARVDHLRRDVTEMQLKHDFRHFPVLGKGEGDVTVENVVGIITVTDISRQALSKRKRSA